ncbi:MAG: hypothetical protein M1821_006693 [Bathelium mastoideum]|nr:MAG: hypothetical protein M1821_006693 [Bathelium mastoideum]
MAQATTSPKGKSSTPLNMISSTPRKSFPFQSRTPSASAFFHCEQSFEDQARRNSGSSKQDSSIDVPLNALPTIAIQPASTRSGHASATQPIPLTSGTSRKSSTSAENTSTTSSAPKSGGLKWEAFGNPLHLPVSCDAAAFPSWPQHNAPESTLHQSSRTSSSPLMAKDILARMDRGVSDAFVERLPRHLSPQGAMRHYEAQQNLANRAALAKLTEKREALARRNIARVRALRGESSPEPKEKTWEELLDEEVANFDKMEQKQTQPVNVERHVSHAMMSHDAGNTHATKDGTSKVRSRLVSFEPMAQTQTHPLHYTHSSRRIGSPYPNSLVPSPNSCEDDTEQQEDIESVPVSPLSQDPLQLSTASGPVSPVSAQQSPQESALITPPSHALSQQLNDLGIILPSADETDHIETVVPAQSASHRPSALSSSCGPTTPALRSTARPGATGITFFEQYETLAHALSLPCSPSPEPIDRSANESPCSTLSIRTSYNPSDCKHDLSSGGEASAEASYQLGPCLCDSCRPPSAGSTAAARAGGGSVVAAASALWAMLNPFAISRSSSSTASPSAMLPEAQESMLSPDYEDAGLRDLGHWEEMQEQTDEEGDEEFLRRLGRGMRIRRVREETIGEWAERAFPLPPRH